MVKFQKIGFALVDVTVAEVFHDWLFSLCKQWDVPSVLHLIWMFEFF